MVVVLEFIGKSLMYTWTSTNRILGTSRKCSNKGDGYIGSTNGRRSGVGGSSSCRVCGAECGRA